MSKLWRRHWQLREGECRFPVRLCSKLTAFIRLNAFFSAETIFALSHHQWRVDKEKAVGSAVGKASGSLSEHSERLGHLSQPSRLFPCVGWDCAKSHLD